MTDDFFSFKNILSIISIPITFLLGIVGFHYKNVITKIEDLDQSTNELKVLVGEHSVHVGHINDSVNKIENKIDFILNKLESRNGKARA